MATFKPNGQRLFFFFSAKHSSFSGVDFIFAPVDLFHEIGIAELIPMTLPDEKALLTEGSLQPVVNRAPRWRFNTTLLHD